MTSKELLITIREEVKKQEYMSMGLYRDIFGEGSIFIAVQSRRWQYLDRLIKKLEEMEAPNESP